MKDCGDNPGQNGEFQSKYDEFLKVINNFNAMRIDPEDELSKVMNNFKTLKIDTRDAEERLQMEKLFKIFKDIKLEINKTLKEFNDIKLIFNSLSPEEYEINNHEPYQVTLDNINNVEANIVKQGLLTNEIESHFQMILNNGRRRIKQL